MITPRHHESQASFLVLPDGCAGDRSPGAATLLDLLLLVLMGTMQIGVDRLWRPAAQRQVRNGWAALHAARSVWDKASSAMFQAASTLVNLHLNRRYIGTLDLGVLQDMDGIRKKADSKWAREEGIHVEQLLKKFDDQVNAFSGILQSSKSMRTYRTGEGPLIMFSNEPTVEGDNGDGAGAPVFANLPLATFEILAEEIVAMYEAELKLKWLLASEFQALVFPKAHTSLHPDSNIQGHEQPGLESSTLTVNVNQSKLPTLAIPELVHLSWGDLGDVLKKRSEGEVSREVLQVYLTSLLIEVNIDKKRIEDIIATVSDEITVPPVSSPSKVVR